MREKGLNEGRREEESVGPSACWGCAFCCV